MDFAVVEENESLGSGDRERVMWGGDEVQRRI
jgi:hypothetical protein